MSFCTIRWCGKNSKTSNYKTDGITFHRYPRTPKLKEMWINATRRENWFPAKYSVVCSRHFSEDCFFNMKNRRRLLSTAVPKLFLPQLTHSTEIDVQQPRIPQQVIVKIEPETSDMEQDEQIPSQHIEAASERKQDLDMVTPDSLLLVNKSLSRRTIELSEKISYKNRQIKNLKETVRNLKKRIGYLKLIIQDQKKKKLENSESSPTDRRESSQN